MLLENPDKWGHFLSFTYVSIHVNHIYGFMYQHHVVQGSCFCALSCDAAGIIIFLSFIAVLSMIAISSVNDHYGCGSFFTSALVDDQPWNTNSDSMPMCLSSSIAISISSAIIQCGMSMHDSLAFMVLHIPEIYSSLYFGYAWIASLHWIAEVPGLHSILMLYWCILSSILWSLCNRLAISFLHITISSLCYVITLTSWENISDGIFLSHGICLVIIILCCYTSFPCWLSFYLQMLLSAVLHCQELHCLETTFHPSLAEELSLDWPLMHLSLCINAECHCRMPWFHSSWWWFLHYHTSSNMYCSRFTHILMMSALLKGHLLLWVMVKTFLGVHYAWKWLQFFFIICGISIKTCSFLRSGCTPSLDISSPVNSILVHLKWHLHVCSFKYSQQHTCIISWGFCHDLFHQHHTLQLKCHLLYQIHLVDLWIFHQFFTGTYHLPAPLQMLVWWICTCLIDV